jgi:hypothetical protein
MDGARNMYLGEERSIQGFGRKKLEERENLEDLDADGKTKLNLILKISLGIAWAALIWLRIRTDGGVL